MTHTFYTSTGKNKHVFIHITCKNKVLMPSGSRQLWLKTGPKGKQKLSLTPRLDFFPGPEHGKEAFPTIFLGFLGCTITPQTTRTSKKNFGETPKFLKNDTRKSPFFAKRTSKTRFGTSFSRFVLRWYF